MSAIGLSSDLDVGHVLVEDFDLSVHRLEALGEFRVLRGQRVDLLLHGLLARAAWHAHAHADEGGEEDRRRIWNSSRDDFCISPDFILDLEVRT